MTGRIQTFWILTETVILITIFCGNKIFPLMLCEIDYE